MSAKLHTLAWQLKLLTYFVLGLSAASIILILLLKKPMAPSVAAPPPLPADLPPAPEYEWSPTYTKIAFQILNPEKDETQIIVWDTKTNTSNTVATLSTAEFWVSEGQLDLAWLGMNTLAYSRMVTDDSLPSWKIIGEQNTPAIWTERDIVGFTPDGKKLLTLVSAGTVPSESLEYEVVLLPSRQIIPTHINANKITCAWFENTSLKCYYTSVDNKKITFIVSVST